MKEKEFIIKVSDPHAIETFEADETPELVRCKDCVNFVRNSINPYAGSCNIGVGYRETTTHSIFWYCFMGKKKEQT